MITTVIMTLLSHCCEHGQAYFDIISIYNQNNRQRKSLKINTNLHEDTMLHFSVQLINVSVKLFSSFCYLSSVLGSEELDMNVMWAGDHCSNLIKSTETPPGKKK